MRQPVDLWPGQAQVLGGPHDGLWVEAKGNCWIYPVVEPVVYNGLATLEGLEIRTVICEYQRYVWHEYFMYLWIFVPIEVFIRTFVIDPELKNA